MDRKGGKAVPTKINIFSAEGQRYLQDILDVVDIRNYNSRGSDQNKATVAISNQTDCRYGCSVCSFQCNDLNKQKQHFQSEWHLFNLRRRVRSKPTVTEEQFEQLIAGEKKSQNEEWTDTSSSSSDEGENEDSVERSRRVQIGTAHSGGVVFFVTKENRAISCYRSVLTPLRSYQVENEQLLANLHGLNSGSCIWIILILSGGHFAGAVFDSTNSSGEAILHKTVHRYTIRAKQGGSQAVRDAQQQSKPKSAGASLRRYNEAALVKDIRELLTVWADYVRRASAIFLRCSVYKRHIFYGGPEPIFAKTDERIRNIPIPTRKPTYEETKRIWTELGILNVYESCDDLVETSQREMEESVEVLVDNISKAHLDSKVETDRPKNVHRVGKRTETRDADGSLNKPNEKKKLEFASPQDVRQELYTACKRGDASSLDDSIRGRMDDVQLMRDYLNCPINEKDGNTFLHLASASGHLELIRYLLDFDCNPMTKNSKGQVAFQVANGRNTRNVFTKFREDHPDRWDWNAAQIPEPVDPRVEEAKKAKMAEKRKAAMKAKAERQKEKKEADAKARAEEEEKRRYLQLSDREKRALAAERRFKTQLVERSEDRTDTVLTRCFRCGIDITGKVPFEYSANRFCTMKCLKQHRTINDG